MFNLFKKKEKDLNLYSPVDGKCISLDDVDDPVFSKRMMGDGVAFQFQGDTVYAPCDGTIMMIANTKHAIGMKCNNGVELLLHVGMNTVELNGEGFTILKEMNDSVLRGEALLIINRDFMKEKKMDLTTPMIITNGNDIDVEIIKTDGEVIRGESIIAHIK